MRRLIFVILLVIVGVSLYFPYKKYINESLNRWMKFSFCDRPIKYRVNSVDKRFNISKEEVEKDVDVASQIWEKIVDKNLFEKSSNGELKINLVYDDRQEILRNIYMLETTVNSQKTQIESTNSQYEVDKAELEKELEDLNKQIDYWNSRGGAPKNIYEALTRKQLELKKKINQLNSLADDINNKVSQINEDVHQLNNNVNNFNSTTQVHPEMGLYTSGINEIDIFFFGTKEDLIHVLAHEMGHSIGLDHVTDKDAIMNPVTSASLDPTEQDKNEIISLCKNKNRIDLIKNDLQNLIYGYVSKITTKNVF